MEEHIEPEWSPPKSTIYVCPHGDDNNLGFHEDSPVKSLQKAADLAAQHKFTHVVLRGDTHYLEAPLLLGPEHSGLTFRNYPGEAPVVSGGKQLTTTWSVHDVSGDKNIYVADVKSQIDEVPGLQINGVRSTRARYPNLPGGIEVSPGYDAMISARDGHWTPPDFNKYGNVTFYTDMNHTRPNNAAGTLWFEHYMVGREGLCSVYDPPVSYWSVSPSRDPHPHPLTAL